MGAYKIISIADKLKNLRQKYNLKQEEVSRDSVTRNLISQIENNKANLTRNVAESVIYNLNKLRGGKNIKIDETVEYLMEDETSQASKILDKCINELKDLSVYKDGNFVTKLSAAEEFLASWDIRDKKITIFELAGDYYCNINDFYNSSLYYEKAKTLINTFKYNETSMSILRKLSMVYFYMGKYDENIKSCDFAINNFTNMSDEYYCIFMFNSALCYLKLKEYNKALKRLSKIEETTKRTDIVKYYKVIEQKVVCLSELQEYEKSIKINKDLLEKIDKNNFELYITILINLANNYIDIKNDLEAKKTLKIIVENVDELSQDTKYLPEIYSEIGKLHKKLDTIDKAKKFYSKALSYGKKFNRNYILDDILLELLDIYTSSKDKEKVSEIKNEYFILSAKEGKIIVPLERKLIEFYLNTEDIKSLRDLRDLYNFNKKLS